MKQQIDFKKTWDGMKRNSHSQFFEDICMYMIFSLTKIGIDKIFYIDIGAYDGITYSNTMMLYKLGARGINIEPMSYPYKMLCELKPKDKNINVAIGDRSGKQKIYKTQYDMCASLNKEYVEKFCDDINGAQATVCGEVECKTVKDILQENNISQFDLLCIDSKGDDKKIIKQFFDAKIIPKVICMETGNGFTKKNVSLQKWMVKNGFVLHSDTFVNSIFISQNFAEKYYKFV